MPTISDFTMEPQLRDQLCWAATAVSVNHWRFKNSTKRQCDIAQALIAPLLPEPTDCCKNLSACNEDGPVGEALELLNVAILPPLGCLSFDDVKREIDANRVICVGIEWADGSSHSVVIYGYEPDNHQTLHVQDPFYDPSSLPYQTFAKNYQTIGTWTDTTKLA